jgi:hypothetical protein
MKKSKRTKLRNSIPSNYGFWCWTLKSEEETQEFINRGDERQRGCLLHVLMYMERRDEELFKKIKGKETIKKLKEKLK